MNLLQLFLLLTLSLLGPSVSFAQELFFRHTFGPYSKSTVEVTALFNKLPSSGYAPIRVTISNRTTAPVVFSLNFDCSADGNSGVQKLESSFSVQGDAEKVTTTDLLVPVAAAVKEHSYGGAMCNQMLELSMIGIVNGNYTQSSNNQINLPNILLSEPLFTPNASRLDAEVKKITGGSSSYYGSTSNFGGMFSASKMPEDWRAYAGYDCLILSEVDWTELSPGARTAIQQWVRLGGSMRIFTRTPSATWATLGIESDEPQADSTKFGKGLIVSTPINAELRIDESQLIAQITSGSGQAGHQYKSFVEDYSAGWGLQQQLGGKTFHFVFFILLLIAFGVIVGPINLFVFAKSGMRHKLFITTPIIALAASLAMIILIFIQDGMGGKGVRVQLVEMPSGDGDNNAYISQTQISRTGVLFSNRFAMTEACSISPLPLRISQWTRLNTSSSNDQAYAINFDDKGIQVSGDWFQSRSEQAQLIHSIVPTRSRIEQTDPANPAALLSSFDHSIDSFFYRDVDGKIWKADAIAPGKKFLCSESTEIDHDKFVNHASTLLCSQEIRSLQRLSKRPGSYVAISSTARMLDTHPRLNWTSNTSIITGSVKPAP
jgi:hypothetical protein